MSSRRKKRRSAQAGGKKAQPTDPSRSDPAPERVQPPGWVPWAAGLASGALSLALYLGTLAPTVTFADAGELAAAVHFLDVAHAPGFPLYLMLGKLFTLLLPWGRLIQRLNAFSALCAAAAVGLTGAALVLGFELVRTRPAQTRRPRQGARSHPTSFLPRWAPLPLALAAAGLLATSRTFWEQATLTEVYALNMAMAAGLLLLLILYLRAHQRRIQAILQMKGRPPNEVARLRAQQQREWARADRLLIGAALLAGLGLGNHLTLLFFAAAVVLAAWLEEGVEFWRRRRLLMLTGAFVLGLSVYLYLPLRAAVNPPFNWGNPDSLVRFWRHVSGKQYQVNFDPSPSTWIEQARFFLPRLWREFSPLPLFLAPLGLYRLFHRCRPLAWGSSGSALVATFYALSYNIAEDQETYSMLFFLLALVWIGQGMAQALEWLSQVGSQLRSWLQPVLAGVFLLLILWPLLGHWPHCDRRSYTYAEAYARDVLDNLPPNALVLTRDWNLFAPAYYLQQVEGVRPDVVLVDQELLRRTWYLDTLERRYPWLAQEARQALEAYRVELVKFEEGQDYAFDTIQSRFQGLGNTLLEAALDQGRPAFVTPDVEYQIAADPTGRSQALQIEDRYLEQLSGQPAIAPGGVGEDYTWVPEALAFHLHAEAPTTVPWEQFRQPALSDGRTHDQLTQKAVEKYALFWLRKGLYFHAGGDCGQAIPAYETALDIDPTLELARQGLADCSSR